MAFLNVQESYSAGFVAVDLILILKKYTIAAMILNMNRNTNHRPRVAKSLLKQSISIHTQNSNAPNISITKNQK